MGLFDRRLLIVTGKGGTGKSTVAASLAVGAAAAGKRVALVEIGGERLAQLMGHPPVGHNEVAIGGGISLLAIDPIAAAHEFLRSQVGGAVHRLMFQNRLFDVTMTAAPGLREVCTMNRVWEMARGDRGRRSATYDLVILDAAATGHALAMLSAPTTYANLARGGPIRARADAIDALVRDPQQTEIVLCGLPEETPINEAVETVQRLDELGVRTGLAVVNQLHETPLDDESVRRLATVVQRSESMTVEARVMTPVIDAHRRARREAEQVARLADTLDGRCRLVALPRIDAEIGRAELDALADRLAVA